MYGFTGTVGDLAGTPILEGPIRILPVKRNFHLPILKIDTESMNFRYFSDIFQVEVVGLTIVNGPCQGTFCGFGKHFNSDGTFFNGNCSCFTKVTSGNTIVLSLKLKLIDGKGKTHLVENVTNKKIQYDFAFKETCVNVRSEKIGTPLNVKKTLKAINQVIDLATDKKWVVSGWMKPGLTIDAVTVDDNENDYTKRQKGNTGEKIRAQNVNLHVCSIAPVNPEQITKAAVEGHLMDLIELGNL